MAHGTVNDRKSIVEDEATLRSVLTTSFRSESFSSASDEALKPPPSDHDDFPDGGFQAWLNVAGGAACFFSTFGWVNCIGIFQDYYLTGPLKSYPASTVGWITSFETFFMLFGGPFFGLAFDNFGPRYLLLCGTFLHVFGLMMASISKEFYQFLLAQGVCSAVGASMIFTPATACPSTWFWKKRGLALGMVIAGSSLGGVVLPVVVSRLIPKIGFGWMMRTCAFIILTLMIFANLTLRSRLPPNKRRPELMAFVRPFTDLPFVLVCCGMFVVYWGQLIPISFMVVDARAHGMSLSLAQYLVSICNAGSFFGRIIPGYIGDKVGRVNTMAVACLLTSVTIVALWIPASGSTALIVFAPIFGFATGAVSSLAPAVMAQISDVREIGIRTGAMFGFSSLAALTSSPIGGALIDEALGPNLYRYAKVWGGVFCFLGAVLYAVARVRIGGWKLAVKV